MGNIFRWDSPLMKFMMLVTNLICLNVLWLLMCLPVVTAGAATTAMYYVIFQYITKQDDAVLKPFFRAFKENFRTVTPIWILNLLVGAAMAAEIFYLTQSDELCLKVVFGVLLFVYSGASSYLYPLIARYDAPVKSTVFNSFALAMRHIFSTVLIVAFHAIPVALVLFAPEIFWKTGIVWLLGGFSLIAYLNGRILMSVFEKNETQVQEGALAMDQIASGKKPALYALRGVSRECPENTLSAIRTAICQGYDGLLLDVQVTADGVPVLDRKTCVSDLTFDQICSTDVGGAFARRFRGETIPKLADALVLAECAGLKVGLILDLVPRDRERDVFLLAKECMLCFRDARRVLSTAAAMPEVRLGYLGEVNGAAMQSLAELGNRVTVWTEDPVETGYAPLGILGVDSYEKLETLCEQYAPDALCTTGVVKPDIRRGLRADIHMHSEYSPDSTCPVAQIKATAAEKGFGLVCITDHCDLNPTHEESAVLEFRKQVVTGIRQQTGDTDKPEILVGVELGGGFLVPELAGRMVAAEKYDVVIGSVHGIMFRDKRQSTAKCDFGKMDNEAVLEYLDRYLDSALYVAENLDVDILAHLTYILRYINGKYRLNVDWHPQEVKIRRILAAIIQRGIPLEINTSSRGGVYDEWLPARQIVDMYLDMGGYLFTFGSDAHVSERIGSYYDEVTDYLRSKGIRYMIYFKERIAHQYSI